MYFMYIISLIYDEFNNIVVGIFGYVINVFKWLFSNGATIFVLDESSDYISICLFLLVIFVFNFYFFIRNYFLFVKFQH